MNNNNTLVIVESPSKAKIIEKYLGNGYTVKASLGHVRDLDKDNIGIDIDNNFEPIYKILHGKNKLISYFKQFNNIILATDSDREGESIAWHLASILKINTNLNNRIIFHEITKNAINHAINNPTKINTNLVNSQQCRRLLDRLVGFEISPILWNNINDGLSAGRVQSVALKIICDKENDINNFSSKLFYLTKAKFSKNIKANLNFEFSDKNQSYNFLLLCSSSIFTINNVFIENSTSKPPPPFITSSLQQDAISKFKMSPNSVMNTAQSLYEKGLITYHRTDSTELSDLFLSLISNYVKDNYGDKYYKWRQFKASKHSQEAHECIRPTNININNINDNHDFTPYEQKIYQLIWQRTIASQMSNAEYSIQNIHINISNVPDKLFISNIKKLDFDGFLLIYSPFNPDNNDSESDNNDKSKKINKFININTGDTINYNEIISEEKYKKPPPRFTESSIIKTLENKQIGRPSTYANIISNIFEKKYVEKKINKSLPKETTNLKLKNNSISEISSTFKFDNDKKYYIFPTTTGYNINDFLSKYFNHIFNYEFTSLMEQKLDDIADGKINWKHTLNEFYQSFHPTVINLSNHNNKNKLSNSKIIGSIDHKDVIISKSKYGNIFKIGNDGDIKPIPNNLDFNDINIDNIHEILLYPIYAGTFNDKPIFINIGSNGYYISYNDNKINIGFDKPSIQDAINKINGSNITSCPIIKTFNNGAKIINGKYGAFITFNKKIYKIPDEFKNNGCENISNSDITKILKFSKK